MGADWLDGVNPLTEGECATRAYLRRDSLAYDIERRLLATVAELRAEVAGLRAENRRTRELHYWAKPLLPEVLRSCERAVSRTEIDLASVRVAVDPRMDALVVQLRATPPPAAEADAGRLLSIARRLEGAAIYQGGSSAEREGDAAFLRAIAARLSAPPQPSVGVVPGEVVEAARFITSSPDEPLDRAEYQAKIVEFGACAHAVARWALSLSAPPEPRD